MSFMIHFTLEIIHLFLISTILFLKILNHNKYLM